MFFKDFVSVKRKKIKKGASQTYDTPSTTIKCTFTNASNTIWNNYVGQRSTIRVSIIG